MSNVYANHSSLPPSNVYANHSSLPLHINEVRYQTLGRSHGFAELNGVPFKIAEKYNFQVGASGLTQVMENLTLSSTPNTLAEAQAYTFELERRVLDNMGLTGR